MATKKKTSKPYRHVGGGNYEVTLRVKGKDKVEALLAGETPTVEVDDKRVTAVANTLRMSANSVRTIVKEYLK